MFVGNSSDIYTILSFTVDAAGQVMAIFTTDEISSLTDKCVIFQDYLDNIADTEETTHSKICNEVIEELTEKSVDSTVMHICEILSTKRESGQIW